MDCGKKAKKVNRVIPKKEVVLPSHSPVKLLLICVFCMATGCFAFDIFIPGLPQMSTSLQCEACDLQWLIGAIAIGSAAIMLVCGPLADAYGRRMMMLGFMALMTFSSLMSCFELPISWLIFWRFLQGVGSGAPFVLCFAIIADVCTAERRPIYFAYLSANLTLSLALAPIVGGYLIVWFGWKSTFVFVFLMSLVSFLSIFFWLPETLRQEKKLDWLQLMRSYVSLLKNTSFIGYGLTPGLLIGAMLSFLSLAAHYLIPAFGMDEVTYGWYQSLFMVAQAMTSWQLSRVIGKIGVDRMLTISIGMAVLSSLGFFLAVAFWPRVLWPFTLSLIIFASSINIALVTHMEKGLSVLPQAYATASALQGVLRGTVVAVSVQVAGLVTQGRPFLYLGFFVALMGLIVLAIYITMTRKTLKFPKN